MECYSSVITQGDLGRTVSSFSTSPAPLGVHTPKMHPPRPTRTNTTRSFVVAFNDRVTTFIAQGLLRSRKKLRGVLSRRNGKVSTAIPVQSTVPLSITGIGYTILASMSIGAVGSPYGGTVLPNFSTEPDISFDVSLPFPPLYLSVNWLMP